MKRLWEPSTNLTCCAKRFTALCALRMCRSSPLLLLCAAALFAPAGCDRPPEPKKKKSLSVADPTTTQPATLPSYSFADPLLPSRFPEVVGFIRQFLETCMVGDYPAYRRLVSRYEEPQSRERFQKIYGGLRSIVVESVDLLSDDQRQSLPATTTAPVRGPVYRVVSSVHFAPESNISLRHGDRRVAILVFQEDGDWRMRAAPANLQPRDDQPSSRDSAPEADSRPLEKGPEYPWDLDGDS